jgi:proteasome accessory factor A
VTGDIYLFKNNICSAGNSYGCHENYLVGRRPPTPDRSSTPATSRTADAGRYRRLHVIVGDSNMNETTLLKAPRDQPRHDRAPQGPAGRRPGHVGAGEPGRVPQHSRDAEFVDREGYGPMHRQMLERRASVRPFRVSSAGMSTLAGNLLLGLTKHDGPTRQLNSVPRHGCLTAVPKG